MDSNEDKNTKVIKLNGSLDSKDIHNDEITCLSGTEAKPDTKVELDSPPKYLIYGIKDSPPIHITIICGIQQGLLSLASQLVVSLLVAQAVCAANDNVFKARLLSSTLFMNGVTTLAMNLLGVRLSLFQGAASEYIIPLLIIGSIDKTFCGDSDDQMQMFATNVTENGTLVSDNGEHMERVLNNVRALSGSLMLAGVIHAALGFTGLIGILLKFVGPITVVPCMVLITVVIVNSVLKLVQINWAIGMSTAGVAIILSLYLANHKMPVPVWTPSLGFRIIWYPVHQVFSILISILFNWAICGILTVSGALPYDPNNSLYGTRTDARINVLSDSPWFNVPYPGQYGMVSFSLSAFIACFIATIISILDSIGDYFACARACRVPVPPAHAVNRGILVEGICSFLSGSIGCGHATTTYGGNIGAIGVTKVASRQTLLCAGIMYILFGILGKVSAVFITIPLPILGGAAVVMFSTFLGVVLSNLQVISLSSSRNMAIIGISIILGLMIPRYMNNIKEASFTGNETADQVIHMILGNPNLAGTIIAFFLDNTVPGSRDERGITAWQAPLHARDAGELDPELYDEGYDVYYPILPKRVLQWNIMKYIPFLPHLDKDD